MDGTETTNPTTTEGAPANTGTNGEGVNNVAPAQTTQTTQTTEPPAQQVTVPDGYVKKEEVESERTARTAAETKVTEAEARARQAETRARQTEIKLHAQRLGFNDLADAEHFIAADVEMDKIGEALDALAASKPYLVKAAEQPAQPVTPTQPTNPTRKETAKPVFSQAQIADRKFWSANKDAIMQAMREGRIQ